MKEKADASAATETSDQLDYLTDDDSISPTLLNFNYNLLKKGICLINMQDIIPSDISWLW